jgi:beta-mannosidase
MQVINAQEQLRWELYHPVKKEWLPAGTHGSVQEKLIATGELPDPYIGQNEQLFSWIEDHKWIFRSNLVLTNEQLSEKSIELQFPGIDTYAAIYVNDSLIGFTDNAFHPFQFDIKKYVHAGKNELEVIFTPPVLMHQKRYETERFHYPAPNDVHKIAIAPLTRKPQYQFGWDWALRMNTIGFLKPVKVIALSHPQVANVQITTDKLLNDRAIVSFTLFFQSKTTEELTWTSNLFETLKIPKGVLSFKRTEIIENPELWWPRGQGKAFLYNDSWKLTANDHEIWSVQKRFGVRTTQLVQEKDQWGTSYVLKVNDRPIFCKGGDYIPQDMFPARVTDQMLQEIVEQMVAANFNMVRVWGGGYYPEEAFFNACDEKGIMVWQDFMFACAMYPGDSAFLSNVKQEIDFQIPRISSHPSLVLFNGNNEVDVAWKNWGFQLKYQLIGKSVVEIEKAYDDLFKKLIPNTLATYSNVPYIHTSPLSNWGKDEFYNHGTQHYWGVWHGKDPLENFAKKIGRFNAEYGFQSFPEKSTIATFSKEPDWDLNSAVMKHHQKSYVGNGMILKHEKILYGEPKNFDDFVYLSQLTQAKAVGLAVNGHRLDAPRCMGTLYWQINDCWQAPTWSSIDYFGNWKALHYEIKKDYEDIAVLSKKNENDKTIYYLYSDQAQPTQTLVKTIIYDLTGKVLFQQEKQVELKTFEKKQLIEACDLEKFEGQNCLLQFQWKNLQGKELVRNYTQLPLNHFKTPTSDVELTIKSINVFTKTAVLELKTVGFLSNFWVQSNQQGVLFDQNFMNYLPGTHLIHISFEHLPEISNFSLIWQ